MFYHTQSKVYVDNEAFYKRRMLHSYYIYDASYFGKVKEKEFYDILSKWPYNAHKRYTLITKISLRAFWLRWFTIGSLNIDGTWNQTLDYAETFFIISSDGTRKSTK